jgi:hypothetical protein
MRLNIATGRDLPTEIANACAAIDRAAASARARYITIAGGQDAIYTAKAAEAQRYKDAGYPMPLDADAYPFIAAEWALYGEASTPGSFADLVLVLRDTWSRKGAQIEGVRVGGKAAVIAATSPASVLLEMRLALGVLATL